MIEPSDNDWRWETRITPVMFDSMRFHITTSHHPDGRIMELAFGGSHQNSMMVSIVDDACILINQLLQRYLSVEKLIELIRRDANGNATSIIGAIILQLAECQS